MALYLLFESPFGYALFHAYGMDEIAQDTQAVRDSIVDFNRFCQVVKLTAFSPSFSAIDGLNQCNAVSEGIMTDVLRTFLELNLPKVKEGKKAKFSVGVSEPKVGSHISEVTKIPCQSNESVLELLRGLRLHFVKFIKYLKLFNEKQFEMAAMCFEKAGDASDENWARAAGLVESAERNTLTNPVKAKTALQKAADIYETIQMYDKAATCYRKLENYENAGRIFLERCVPPKFEDAGDCFATIGRWSEAADAYFQAKCSSKCAFACSKGDLLDTGFHYFEKWKLEEEQMLKFRSLRSIRDDYIKNCANLVDQYGDVRSTMQFLKTLNSMEKIRVFLMSKMDIRVLLSGMLQAEGLLEEFFEQLLRDAAGIVDVIGDVLSWLGKNKPRVGFYDQLFEDARNALNTIACRGGEKHSDPTLEDLGSLWQDGQAKLKLIMYAHSKPMGSKVASEGEPIDPVVASLQDLCMDSMECVLSYTSEQGTDGKSYDGLLSAVLCMHDESKSSSFDDHLVEEMKQIYNSFSDLARGDAPTLEDLYSKWPHGEIKLKLILGTVITAHKTIPHSYRSLGSRPATSIMVEETAVARTSEGSCSTPKKNASKGNKKSKKGGKKKRG